LGCIEEAAGIEFIDVVSDKDAMSAEDCRKMVELQGRELIRVTAHMVYSRTPDGKVWQQWRPSPRFSMVSRAHLTGAEFHWPVSWLKESDDALDAG
jgi:hypothetical protein